MLHTDVLQTTKQLLTITEMECSYELFQSITQDLVLVAPSSERN